ncbi:hypothetical protein BH23GEM8_BH23GEM8_16470 [soil metagenome]
MAKLLIVYGTTEARPVSLDDPFGDRQVKTRSRAPPALRLPEPVEDVAEIRFRNAVACIATKN